MCTSGKLDGVRVLTLALAPLVLLVGAEASSTLDCAMRAAEVNGRGISWRTAQSQDRSELDQWCRAVGTPIIVAGPASAPAPPLDELVIVSWNVHLDEGRLGALIADLRAGALTDGRPAEHFVLLLQELVRGDADIPAFGGGMRSAFAITAGTQGEVDPGALAAAHGLSMIYVPSMRNGGGRREDRGNGILSTIPLSDLRALELPLERQRRVALSATIHLAAETAPVRLRVATTHLEPLSSPSSLWFFRNPRRRQMGALLDWLRDTPVGGGHAGIVLGGDFNTIQAGDDETAYRDARAWSKGLMAEDARPTHAMGRLDYIFVRLADGWSAETSRVADRYGSDHHPVIARFRGASAGS